MWGNKQIKGEEANYKQNNIKCLQQPSPYRSPIGSRHSISFHNYVSRSWSRKAICFTTIPLTKTSREVRYPLMGSSLDGSRTIATDCPVLLFPMCSHDNTRLPVEWRAVNDHSLHRNVSQFVGSLRCSDFALHCTWILNAWRNDRSHQTCFHEDTTIFNFDRISHRHNHINVYTSKKKKKGTRRRADATWKGKSPQIHAHARPMLTLTFKLSSV